MLFIEHISVFNLLSVLVSVLVIFVTFFKWRFTYWKRLGIPQLSPIIPFGDMKDALLQKHSLGEQFIEIYKTIKSKGLKYAGVYFSSNPVLVVIDPELIKIMMVRDFSHFMNHTMDFDVEKEPLSGHLFGLKDNEWKSMRQKLTPTFTSGKIKTMFDTINNCALGLKDLINESAETQQPVDIKEMMSRFSTDVIGSVAFGIECNSLKDPDCEFRHFGRRIFQMTRFESFKITLSILLPKFIMRHLPIKLSKRDVEKFFMSTVSEMVYLRKNRNIYRKDFLQLLVELKNETNSDKNDESEKKDSLTLNQIAAQVFIFFIAGFETTSTTLTFTMYELAMNQDIQDKLRDEIRAVLKKHDDQISYEALTEMVYMEKVIYETLRKYPPVPQLNRICTKDFVIPNTSILLKKGTHIEFALEGLQNDPDYYPDPRKFDPERYTNEDKNNRPWMPFGDGPRNCIGMRFAMVEMKVSLTNLIKYFRFKLNPKTPSPLKYSPRGIIKAIEGSVYLDIEKI